MVQCFTGVLLLVYYRPGAEAYESVRQITFVMHFGWLIRSAHSWSANLMIFSILVHMFSVFFMKAYRKPREFGWLSGMALLGLASVFGFSGYLLPMDELSYFATKVGLEIPAAIPWIGPVIGNMLRGGLEVNEFTVQRFFALHVVVLPALFLPLLGFHLWLVQTPRQRRSAGRRSEAGHRSQDDAVLSQLPAQRSGHVADLAQHSGAAGFGLSVVARQAGRFAGARAAGHSSRVVLHEPLRNAQAARRRFLPGEAGEIAGILLFTLGIALWVMIPFYDTNQGIGTPRPRRTLFRPDRSVRAAGHHGHWLLDDSVRQLQLLAYSFQLVIHD